ncbi:MAG: alpha/beta hydrolase, partial [Oscillibacter sp.]|nr:alpha/beta hydrolase [Oscillibacter sp.]
MFPAYVNSLGLKDRNGTTLTLDRNGEGSFKEYLRDLLLQSAQRELDTHDTAEWLSWLAAAGSAVERQSCLTIRDGTVVSLDWDAYVKTITRMKPVPAFDALDLKSPENEEFGTETCDGKHFTSFSQQHTEAPAELAEAA